MVVRTVAGLVLLLTLSACGGSGDASAPSTSPSDSPSAAGTPSTLPSTVSPSESPSAPTEPSREPSSVPVPAAKDGQNYQACNDGTCEVLIRGKATLTLNGEKNTVTVVNGTVKLVHNTGYVSLSGGGYSSWGRSGGPLHSASLKYAEGNTAVLILTTRR